MTEINKLRTHIIGKTIKLINKKFETRMNELILYSRIFYASILSDYDRANSFGMNVGIMLPELEEITKALYSISKRKKNKHGSFDPNKAFEVASTLDISYKIPMTMRGNTITYKLKFATTHPLLVALEKGEVSWENMEKHKILKILRSALSTLKVRSKEGMINTNAEFEIKQVIDDINFGNFNIAKNKRPYMEILIKNIVKQKDFINILIK